MILRGCFLCHFSKKAHDRRREDADISPKRQKKKI